ncbi:MAG TPA: serine/threonine-protein kinase [Gemmatimonadales bacterium]|nr:serine/threonine-protein kinase [Gemmatimonadales bacterium]
MSTNLFDQLQTSLGTAYRLERELGGGGMSRVFLAHESALGRKVVVKVLHPELAAGVSIDRFRREIQLAAQLQHPHIVPLLSAGESDGLPYFIMPFIAGESLRVKLSRQGELPVIEVVRILRDVVSALAYAHESNIMHRDVKPDNVLITGGVAVVTDFGVAKALSVSSESPGATNLTSVGVALGTPTYMAPEQAAGSPQIDHRADLYALGIMGYEMLAGRTPFWGRSVQGMLAAHVIEAPEPIDRLRPALPPVLSALIMQCLAKHPADRPQSAGEVMQVLDSFSTPGTGTTPTTAVVARSLPATVVTPALTPTERRRTTAIAAAAAGLVLLGGAAVWFRSPYRGAEPAAAPAPLAAESAAAVKPDAPPPVPSPPRAPEPTPAPTEEHAEAEPPRNPTARAPEPEPAAAETPPRTKPRHAAPVAAAPARAVAPDPSAATTAPRTSVSSTQAARSPKPASDPAAASPPPATPPKPAAPESAGARPAEAAAAHPAAVPTAPNPPAPPPAAPRAPPAAAAPTPPAADPRAEIRGVIAAYAGAVESQNIDNIKRMYPGMTAEQQRAWEQFFRTVRDVKAQLAVAQLDLPNGAAEAQVTGTYTYLNTSTRATERVPVNFHATLRRDAGGWRISQVR